ncbi:Os09g0567201 [Oryza sativa Japonica Group]|uniref:Os09g0567201 protein n=1 Tax=Oryza sativa subsp. japonica TaxID=39947 RepID=A0A0P0XRS1_ORYSJ|nr:hypothetical protein EE612_049542 [Oryza sativa]BAT09470.1 Os09g0567201 [Oryza sativa Japonica Group]
MNCAPPPPPPANHQSCTSHITSTTAPSPSTAVLFPRKFHFTRRASTTFFPSMLTATSPSRVPHSSPRHTTATSCSAPSARNLHRVLCATAAAAIAAGEAGAARSCSRRLSNARRGAAAKRRASSRAASPPPRRTASSPSATTAR